MKNSLSQVLLRLHKKLHQDLKKAADAEGLSLNQYCLFLLARHSPTSESLQTKKAEDLLSFVAQAKTFQKELGKNKKVSAISVKPQETPIQRYKKLYGKNRHPVH